MKIPEHPGAQALKLTSTRGSGNLWTIWCSAWTIDCLWSSCFKSHASVAHVASRPFLLIDVDRTLYTLTTGPMAWVVLKINLDTFWWFCMSLHVQVLLFFLFELIVWILAKVIHVDQLQVMYPRLRWTFTSWAAVVSSLRRSAWAWGRMVQSLARSTNGDYCNMEILPANTWITPSKTGLWF